MSKRIEEVWKFLQAARNLVKNKNISIDEVFAFAKRQFGEVDDFLRLQINNLFKTPKVSSPVKEAYKKELRRLEGALGSLDPKQPGFKQAANELIEKITKLQKDYKTGKFVPEGKADVVPIKKKIPIRKDQIDDIESAIKADEGDDFIDFVRKQGDEEGANKIQKEVNRINKAIEDADKKVAAKKTLETRTADIKRGDPEGEGVESLDTSMKKIKKLTDELKKNQITPESIFDTMIKSQRVMAEGYKTGNIRTAVREFMRSEQKAGRLKLNETDSFRIREYSPMNEDDPIDVFRRHYGEDALEAVDEIGDVFMRGESFKHYEELLRNSVDKKFLTVKKVGAGEYDASVVAGEKIRKAKEQEAKNRQILEEFDTTDRTKNADGGLIDILKL